MPGGMLLAVLVLTSFNENAPGGNAFGVGGDTAGLMSSRAKAAVASPTHCSRSSCVTLKRTCADVPFSLFMPVAAAFDPQTTHILDDQLAVDECDLARRVEASDDDVRGKATQSLHGRRANQATVAVCLQPVWHF